MGISPADRLQRAPPRRPTPTFAEYVPVVSKGVSDASRRAYASYRKKIVTGWSERRLDEPTPSEIKELAEHIRANVVVRRNARGGTSAVENFITALRCLYNQAIADGHIQAAAHPASKVDKPRRLKSTRGAVRLAEINNVAATTGDDPALDTLLLRLHIETACRRGGALALRPADLDPAQCVVRLREKGGAHRWQPVSPTLMAHLQQHARERRAPCEEQLLRYRDGRPITHRRYDHLWQRIGRHLPWVATPTDQHTLAATHHADLGGAHLRLRHGPRLRRPRRQQQVLGRLDTAGIEARTKIRPTHRARREVRQGPFRHLIPAQAAPLGRSRGDSCDSGGVRSLDRRAVLIGPVHDTAHEWAVGAARWIAQRAHLIDQSGQGPDRGRRLRRWRRRCWCAAPSPHLSAALPGTGKLNR
jgi:site-specific recombinase XerD